MPTRYFKNSVSQFWDTLGNWWANAACDEGFSGTLTGVTVTDTDATVTCDSTAGLVVGRPITGTGIDTGSTVASITDGTTFELSLPAIANGSSNLTCEKHVIPVTGDDVVVATDTNHNVEGTPSADVLGTVTITGVTRMTVTLEAANFVFNDSSLHNGTFTGDATFNDSSYFNYGNISGKVTWNSNYHGTVPTGGVFNISADIWAPSDAFHGTVYGSDDVLITDWQFSGTAQLGSGSATGNVTFNDTSSFTWGIINGDCTFNDSSYIDFGGDTCYIQGSLTFYGSSYVGDVSIQSNGNDITFNDYSFNEGTITGNATFNDSSYNDYAATVTGNATFNDFSYNSSGYVTGDCVFNGTSYNDGYVGNCEFNDSSYNNYGQIGNTIFNDYSYNRGYSSGASDFTFNNYSYNRSDTTNSLVATTITFNDYSYNRSTIDTPLVATTVTFNDFSTNGLYSVSPGYITGNCVFNNSSFNEYNGNVNGNCTFTEAEYSSALQGGSWPGSGPQQGTVSGTVTFSSITPVKFTLVGSESWVVNTSGWVFDTAGQNWEFNGESYNAEYGTVTGDCVFNGGASFAIPYQNQGTVNGNCVFNVYNAIYTTGVVNGDCVFNDARVRGTVNGNCTFNGYSWSDSTSTITGDCEFYGGSAQGNITGNATFNDYSYNVGPITGNASFTNTAFSTATNGFFNPQQGSVSGTVNFPNGCAFTLANSESWTVNASGWAGALAWVFNDTSYNASGATITGNPTFNDSSYSNSTITGDATFNGTSFNSGGGTITGNATFNDSSNSNGTVTGNASFTNTAFSTATTGFFNPQQGTVSGTVDFPNGATFTLANSEQWATDASGWTGTLAWEFNGSSCNNYNIAGDCTFNNSSYNANYATIWGNPTFNDSSYAANGNNGIIYGDPTFNDTSHNAQTINGNPTFNDSSYSYGYGIINGDPTFNDTSYNGGTIGQPWSPRNATFNDSSFSYGTINGNASFTNTVQSTATTGFFNPQQGSVSGTVNFPNGCTFTLANSEQWTTDASGWTGALAWEFNDSSYNSNNITGSCTFNGSGSGTASGSVIVGDCTFNDSKYHGSGTISGTCVFNDYSYVDDSASIIGNVTFTNTAFSYATTGFNSPLRFGYVSGTVNFPNGAIFTLVGSESWPWYASTWTGPLAWVFNGFSSTTAFGSVSGNITFNDSSYNDSSDIGGNITFNDSSYNDANFNPGGNVTFNDSSYNNNNNTIQSDCTFNDNSYNIGTITGNASFTNTAFSTATNGFFNPQQGGVSGTVTFTSLTPVKFTLAGNESWEGDTTNWVFNTAGQNWEFNDTSYTWTGAAIYGNCVFNSSSSYGGHLGGTIYGDVIFNGASTMSSYIEGDVIVNDSIAIGGFITGNVTFNDNSNNNSGTITGSVTFNDTSYNAFGGIITGNGIIRQHAAAFTNWRDYATSTYITGTLTLQFPEMDILGTGLL